MLGAHRNKPIYTIPQTQMTKQLPPPFSSPLKLNNNMQIFPGKQLEDDKIVADYNTEKDSMLNLVPRSKGAMQIPVKTVHGNTIMTVEVGDFDTLDDVKLRIKEKTGIHEDQICLIFGRKKLVDGLVLDQMDLIQTELLGTEPWTSYPTFILTSKLVCGANVLYHLPQFHELHSEPNLHDLESSCGYHDIATADPTFHELKNCRTGPVQHNLPDKSPAKLLSIESQELKFPFHRNKSMSCSFQLPNKTDNYLAFEVLVTDPMKFCVRPNRGIIMPHSTRHLMFTMQAQDAPPDLQCKDTFLIRSLVVRPGASLKDINSKMFLKGSGNVTEDCKLTVSFGSPPQPPPVAPKETKKNIFGKHLSVKPQELKSPFQVKKQVPCPLQLPNKTNDYGGFKFKAIATDIDMRNFTESGNVLEECELKAHFLPPHPPSAVHEEINGIVSEKLLRIKLQEVKFPFRLNKETSCSVQLPNRTDKYVAFKVKTTAVDKNKYYATPSCGVISPQSTCHVIFTLQAQRHTFPDLQCKDKFLIRSIVVKPGATLKDINSEMFVEKSGNLFEDCYLTVSFVSPSQPPSVVPEKRKETISGKLLSIEPGELKFPFELNKQASCSLQLPNKTDNYVAFKVMVKDPKKYCASPYLGIILPQSTGHVMLKMQAQKEVPPLWQCKDKFLIQSIVMRPGTALKDVNVKMFDKESGNKIEECKLKVVFVPPPQPPSTIPEGTMEIISNEEDISAIEEAHEVHPELDLLKSERSISCIGIHFFYVCLLFFSVFLLGYTGKV